MTMRKVIPSAALAALGLYSSVALAADPVCGDVNDTGTVSASDALLVLKKGVDQPIELDCSAYDERFSGAETALASCLLDLTPVVVAVGDGDSEKGGFVSRSIDGGVTWVDATTQPPAANKINGVTSNGSTIVAVDDSAYLGDTLLVFRSVDRGDTWVAAATQPVGNFLSLKDVASNGSNFVAIDGSGTVFLSHDDGDTWAEATTSPTGGLTGIAARGARFVAVGASSAYVSVDNGDTWAPADTHPPGASQLTRVAANDTAFVAVGNIGSTGAVFTSYDGGVNWNVATTQPVSPGFLIDSVATDGSRFLIGSYNPGRIYYSDDDGDTWTTATTNPVSNIALNAVAFIDHRCVAVDLGGNAHWSADRGVHWYESYVQSPGIAGYYGATH
jgi:photosystem II stability/assembly factor-like uncharacterized protein